ncbi:tetratricopeptide repeat protein [Isosphaeraceae bacterium EP7]
MNPYTGAVGTKTRDPNGSWVGGSSSYAGTSATINYGYSAPAPQTSAESLHLGFRSVGTQDTEIEAPSRQPIVLTEAEKAILLKEEAERIQLLEREEIRLRSLQYAEVGLAHYVAGNFRSAIVEYNRAIALDPTNPKLFYCRGTMYSRLGDFDQAIVDLNKAISLKGDFKEAHIGIGYVYSGLPHEWRAPG